MSITSVARARRAADASRRSMRSLHRAGTPSRRHPQIAGDGGRHLVRADVVVGGKFRRRRVTHPHVAGCEHQRERRTRELPRQCSRLGRQPPVISCAAPRIASPHGKKFRRAWPSAEPRPRSAQASWRPARSGFLTSRAPSALPVHGRSRRRRRSVDVVPSFFLRNNHTVKDAQGRSYTDQRPCACALATRYMLETPVITMLPVGPSAERPALGCCRERCRGRHQLVTATLRPRARRQRDRNATASRTCKASACACCCSPTTNC